MNRCVQVPEILQIICNGLPDQRSCLSMALTCRSFCEPALDNLWHSIDSFLPMIQCLPEDLLHFPTGDQWIYHDFDEVEIERPLQPEDLHRYLDFYAPRIQRIEFRLGNESMRMILATEALQLLRLATDSKPGALSPRLKHFVWPTIDQLGSATGYDFANRLIPLMSLFVGESLSSLEIPSTVFTTEEGSSPLQLSALHLITGNLKRLRSLELHGKYDPFGDRNRYITSHAWTGLSTIACAGSVSPDLMLHLASLPQLQSLDTSLGRLTEGDPLSAALQNASVVRFPSIKALNIFADDLGPLNSLIQLLPQATGIQAIYFRTCKGSPTSSCKSLIQSIADKCNPSSLKELRISEMTSSRAEEVLDLVEPQVELEALRKFRSLKRLQLNFCAGVKLEPTTVKEVIGPLKHLEHLDLCPARPQPSKVPKIDHIHIIDLLANLPCLLSLGIRFDTTQINGGELPSQRAAPLRKLCVGRSPICSPTRVRDFFKAHFPKLKELDCCCGRKPKKTVSVSAEVRWELVMNHYSQPDLRVFGFGL